MTLGGQHAQRCHSPHDRYRMTFNASRFAHWHAILKIVRPEVGAAHAIVSALINEELREIKTPIGGLPIQFH